MSGAVAGDFWQQETMELSTSQGNVAEAKQVPTEPTDNQSSPLFLICKTDVPDVTEFGATPCSLIDFNFHP